MNVYVAQSLAHKPMTVDKRQHFFVLHRGHHGKVLQKREYHSPILEISACKLTDNERMTCHVSIIEQFCEMAMRFTQMNDPYGCIDKHHFTEFSSVVWL